MRRFPINNNKWINEISVQQNKKIASHEKSEKEVTVQRFKTRLFLTSPNRKPWPPAPAPAEPPLLLLFEYFWLSAQLPLFLTFMTGNFFCSVERKISFLCFIISSLWHTLYFTVLYREQKLFYRSVQHYYTFFLTDRDAHGARVHSAVAQY